MTVAKLLTQPDTLNDIGILVSRLFLEFEKLGFKTLHILKFLLYDVTITLQKLPFGNWISVIYFIVMSNILKNVVEGGELSRLLYRAIYLYFIQRKTHSECLSIFKSYLWRITMAQINEAQSFAYGVMVYVWEYTGGSVKREVKRFAKEVILENKEEIETAVTELAKTAAFSAMVSTVSQKLASELGPVAMDAFSKSDIAKSIVVLTDNVEASNIDISHTFRSLQRDIQDNKYNIKTLSLNLAESLVLLGEANTRGELHLLENNISLNQKLAEISMQLEYIRLNQPNQFREILKTISLSTLALNDIGVPSTVVDAFAKLTESLTSSSPRRRIENI